MTGAAFAFLSAVTHRTHRGVKSHASDDKL